MPSVTKHGTLGRYKMERSTVLGIKQRSAAGRRQIYEVIARTGVDLGMRCVRRESRCSSENEQVGNLC